MKTRHYFEILYRSTKVQLIKGKNCFQSITRSKRRIVWSRKNNIDDYIGDRIHISLDNEIDCVLDGYDKHFLPPCDDCEEGWSSCECSDDKATSIKYQINKVLLYSELIEKLDEPFDCPICKDEICYKSDLATTKCSHTFCKGCLRKSYYSDEQHRCPMCRSKIEKLDF